MYHGQLCMSTERLIVQESVAAAFKHELIQVLKSKSGVQGSAVNAASAQHALDVVSDAKAKGKEFLFGEPKFVGPVSLDPAVVLDPKNTRMEDEEVGRSG